MKRCLTRETKKPPKLFINCSYTNTGKQFEANYFIKLYNKPDTKKVVNTYVEWNKNLKQNHNINLFEL